MKKLLLFLTIFGLGFGLAACDPKDDPDPVDCDANPTHEDCDEPDPDPITFTFVGLDLTAGEDFNEREIVQDSDFNVYEGVTALGSDGVDYTDRMLVTSADCYIEEDGTVSTSTPGVCTFQYDVDEPTGWSARLYSYLTIRQRSIDDIEFGPVVKEWTWDTAADNEGWNIYTAGGGAVEISWDEVEHGGSMKLVTMSGGLRYETRIDFQGLALEQGYPVKVSFDAKSSIDGKKFHFNFGELLPASPWFTPFKPENAEIFTLTDEWAHYEFWFRMDLDNQNGGPVIEMGNIEGSENLHATIWFDNLVIEGGSGMDVFKPVISGANDVTVFIEDGVFDPLAGVTAYDGVDGDITANILVNGDTVDPTVAGVYYLNYVVYDAAGNWDLAERWVTVENDTDGPVLEGALNTTVFVGEGVTPLTGVTASDNRDGDVTANIVVTGDEMPVDVAGVYNLVYTVTDAAGNETVVERVVQVLDLTFEGTDLIVNGDFDVENWQFFTAEWNGSKTKFSIVNGEVVAEITEFGLDGGNPFIWGSLVEQTGIQLEVGKTYRVSFDAMSTVARDVIVELDGDALSGTVSLTDTMTTHTLDLVYAGTEAKAGVFKLLLGEINGAGLSTVTIDNIKVEEFDGSAVVAETNQIVNGDFSDAEMLGGWGSWSEAGDEDFRVYYNEGWFTYNVAGDQSWKNKLEQGGVALEAGKTYRLSFKAKGDAARDFQVSFWDGSAGTESGALALTTDFQEYSFIFTYDGAPTATLEFQLGQLTENFAGSRFWVDDVTLEVAIPGAGAPTYEMTDLIPNGTFDANPWFMWAADWNATSATLDMSSGAAVLDIANVGVENWNIQFVQEGLALVENQTYRLTFNAMSTADRDINVKIIAADGTEYTEMVSLTATDTVYTVDFTFAQADSAAKISIELGGAQNGIVVAVPSVVTFDNFMLEETDAIDGAVVADTDQVVNGDLSISDLEGWSSWSADWFNPSLGGALSGEWDELVFRYDLPGDASWNHQINFDGIAFEVGKTYKLVFDAKGDAVRDFQVNIYDGSAGYESGALQLTTEFVTYEHIFTYELGAVAKVEFQLGALTANVDGSTFWLDNVAIYEEIPPVIPVYEDTDLIPNGTFDANPWFMWAADWNATSATLDMSSGAAVLDIANVGVENWNIQFVQEGLALVENQTYRLTFNAMSTADRDINVKIIAADGTEYTEMVSLTATDTVYTVDFTFAQADSAAKISIELGGAQNGIVVAVPSVVTFDNFMLEETDAIDGAVVADTDQVVNGDLSISDLEGWSSWSADWFNPSLGGALSGEWDELVFRYDLPGDASWNHQINFDGIAFEVGKTYKLVFDAKGDAVRDFQVNIYDGSAGYESGALQLTTEFVTYEHIFTYELGAVAKVEFQLGALTANVDGSTFWLDNVMIEVLVEEPAE